MASKNLSIAVAFGVLSSIADYTSADFSTLGITIEDYNLLRRETQWKNTERTRVMRTMDALVFGTTDILGLDRISLPAEYLAAIVAAYVHPVNRLVMCHWLTAQQVSNGSAADIAELGVTKAAVDQVTTRQLFALVIQLTDSACASDARQKFEERINKRLQKAIA